MARFFIACRKVTDRAWRTPDPVRPASHLELPKAALELSRQAIEHPATIGRRRHGLGCALSLGMDHLDPPTHRIGALGLMCCRLRRRIDPVSYTHLTLPTIYSV